MDNCVCISFYLRNSTIHIHQATLKGINYPAFVGFLYDSDKKKFAIKSFTEKNFKTFRVHSKHIGQYSKAKVHSYGLCNYLAHINVWNPNYSYRVYGKAYPNQGIAVFDFSSAEIIGKS